jgi:chromosome transmission fidelity protein 1
LGISLLNKVLVFDEAHNIMETVSSLNNVTVNYSVLYQGFSHTQAYLRKYEARLSAKNAKFLRDVSQICADFSKYIRSQWTR